MSKTAENNIGDLSKMNKVQLQLALESLLSAFQRNVKRVNDGRWNAEGAFYAFEGAVDSVTEATPELHKWYTKLKQLQ